MIINKKIIRNMKEHKSTFIVAIVLLMLSTMLFTMFWTGSLQISDGIDKYKKDYKVEDVYFTTAMPINNIEKIEKDFDVELEEMQWKDFKVLDDVNLRIYKERDNINLHQVIDGKDLEGANDLIVNSDFYSQHHKEYGDKISIDKLELNLVGKSASPDYIYMLENDATIFTNKETFAVGFVSEETFNKISNTNKGYSVIFNKDNKEEFKGFIKENNLLLSFVNSENNSRITAIDGDLNGMFLLGQYIPIVIMLMVSILVAIVLWRLIKGELKELGTLYALGYTKERLVKHYIIYPIVVAVIGSTVSQIPAVLASPVLMNILSVEYSLPNIEIIANPIILILSILIPGLIIIPLNYFVINNVLKHSAVDLMKGKIKEEGPSLLERKISIKSLSFVTRFKIKDIARNMGRTVLTLITIIFSSMLIFLVLIMTDSINNIIEKGYEDSYQFKNIYSLSNISDKEVDGEKFWALPVKTKDKNGNEVSFNLEGREKDTSLLKLVDNKGNKLSFKDNIITDSLAKKIGVREGDEIIIQSDINDSKITIKIDKVAESYLGQTLYIPLEKLYEETKIPKNSYIGVISDKDLDFNESEISSMTSKESMLTGVQGLVAPLKGIMILIGVLAALIGMAMIYVITSMIIDENKINISMFKIMGYQNEKLTKIILNTNDMLVMVGFLISIPLSKYFISVLFEEVTKNLDFSIKVQLTLSSTLIVFVTLIFVYWVSKRLSRRKVLNISMDEVLKNGRE